MHKKDSSFCLQKALRSATGLTWSEYRRHLRLPRADKKMIFEISGKLPGKAFIQNSSKNLPFRKYQKINCFS